MATRTFSSRVDEIALEYVDALTHQQFGMSYGQYCGSILIEAIRQGAELPKPIHADKTEQKKNAVLKMKAFSKQAHDTTIGRMSDEEIKDLIAGQYE